MLNILFIGDIVGKIGRKTITKLLPALKKEYKIDFVIANAENSAHGSGVTENIIIELMDAGVDFFTTGDHAFQNKKDLEVFHKYPITCPANFSPRITDGGYKIVKLKKQNILIINLIGRVFMHQNHECPFNKINEILANKSLPHNNISAIIIDIHAETTSEKINLLHYLNGRVSAVLGTHTHVMTADHQISRKGTAFITDVGMTGSAGESLGISHQGTLKTFLTQIKQPHVIPEKGPAQLNAVIIEVNTKSKKANKIKPIIKKINIR